MKRATRRMLSDATKVSKWEVSIANAYDAIPTSCRSLDKALDGGLYVILGATGTGKTSMVRRTKQICALADKGEKDVTIGRQQFKEGGLYF